MQIGITNPLREFLKWRPFAPNNDEQLILCWDAHRVKIDGRIMLVLCNAANRYACMQTMRTADWKRLGETCRSLIRRTMIDGGFSEDAVDAYLARAGEIEYGRTHGRKAVGCMNRLIDTLQWYQCNRDDAYQAFLTHVANFDDLGSCATHEGLGIAAERMEEDLCALGIDPFGNANRGFAAPNETAASDDDGRATASPQTPGSTQSRTLDRQGTPPPTASKETGAPPDELDCASLRQNESSRTADETPLPGKNNPDPSSAVSVDEFEGADTNATAPTQSPNDFQSEIVERIFAITRSMRLERGLDSDRLNAHYGACTICGVEPRVFLGRIPYCLNCYNELTERLMGVPHVTNDRSVIAVFCPRDSLVQFAVERVLTPPIACWTAREIVDDNDPRKAGGYEGVEVQVHAPANEDADETLALLWEKAQEAISRPSTHAHESINIQGEQIPAERISNGAHVNGEVRFAENVGWARIAEDEHGKYYAVVDGQRYNADQFLGLFTNRIGFNLHWEAHEPSDPLPEPQ